MFRFHKTRDVVTLFHDPKAPLSMRIREVLRQASANAAATSTVDQASDHSAQSHARRREFELEVTESAPTPDQLRSILEYIGASKVSLLVPGAKDEAEAVQLIKLHDFRFKRPVTVDWSNGRAVIGVNESRILKMLNAPSKN
ncbi:hypothetical protein DSL72_006519 [Monilinia vaccinii-corymbosi]|uniref:Glutaredoxin domain-containing protein n=1 Tax=Monilinia vaccinii-corymbosi TaxID=61207 RepID=A0A8A3PML7_9HELO|nr:hypothetical protein DSL72_006519 [Monilinia vaccinii-corymbosi]